MPTIQQTIEFIKHAHAGQVDKAGNPYYMHPLAVYNKLPMWTPQDVRHATLCHHLISHTQTTPEMLRAQGYSSYTISLVQAVATNENTGQKLSGSKLLFRQNRYITDVIASGDEGLITMTHTEMQVDPSPDHHPLLPGENLLQAFQKSCGSCPGEVGCECLKMSQQRHVTVRQRLGQAFSLIDRKYQQNQLLTYC